MECRQMPTKGSLFGLTHFSPPPHFLSPFLPRIASEILLSSDTGGIKQTKISVLERWIKSNIYNVLNSDKCHWEK